MSLESLQRDTELNSDAPQEPLLSKSSDDPDPPKSTQTPSTSAKRFERPNYLHIFAHVVWCCAAYPIIYAGTVAAKDTSLFLARAIVGVWCSGIGFVTGWSLMSFATKYAEAATWATVIHLSHGGNEPGIKLGELAHRAQKPESALSGVKLLWTRFSNRGTDRRARRAVDSRPWSFFITFYVILILAAAGLPFILGRVINISTRLEHQSETYAETTIWGDLSESDITAAVNLYNASTHMFVNTWTLTAFTDRSLLPGAVRLKYNGDNVYFPELVQSQLKSDGKGLGAFVRNGTVSDLDEPTIPSMAGLSEGSLLNVPRWGIRMHCEKIPEPEKYLVPLPNATDTFVIVTWALLEKLFSSLSLPIPDRVMDSSTASYMNWLPSGINVSQEEVGHITYIPNYGLAHSFDNFESTMGESGNGSNFSILREFHLNRAPVIITEIGFDAVVCVEAYEPWIVQIYNSSLGVPTTMAIVGKSASTDFETDYGARDPHLDSYTRALNSTGKDSAFRLGIRNAIGQMTKDNDPILEYWPSPLTTSFMGNVGPEGYTELSPQFYADVRGKVAASYTLPLLSGTRLIAVRAYKDVVLASASFNPYILTGVLGVALLLGVLAGFSVPTLPFNIPQRGFGMFSWVAVLYGQELGGVFWQDNVDRHTDLKELEKSLGEEKVHFII